MPSTHSFGWAYALVAALSVGRAVEGVAAAPSSSPLSTSLITPSTSSASVGAFVASGFSVTTIPSPSSAPASSGSSGSGSGSSGSSASTIASAGSTTALSSSSAVSSGSSSSSSGSTSATSSGSSSSTGSSSSLAASSTTSNGGNATAGGVNGCWTSWSSYWAANGSVASGALGSPTATTVITSTTTETDIYGSFSAVDYTSTDIDTETIIETENGFTVGTVTSTITDIFTVSSTDAPASTVIYTRTYVETETLRSSVVAPGVTPMCTLPPYVSQCQSEWVSYVSNTSFLNPTPSCSQASITGADCTQARSEYVSHWILSQISADNLGAENGLSAGYVPYTQITTMVNGTPEISELSTWPATSTLAPGCTLGCGNCAVTGGSVRLLYWPQGTATATNGSSGGSTVVTLGTTFTSPTLYISFASVFASDSCSGVGSTEYNVIAPIQPTDLSSLWATYTDPLSVMTAPFTIADLNSPVPQSIYNSQLRCAESTWFYELSAGMNTQLKSGPLSDQITCARSIPYEPLLVVPAPVLQGLQGDWSGCAADIRGLYDPPIPLTPVGAVASATVPGQSPSQSASPASTPQSQNSQPTAKSPQPTPQSAVSSSPGNPGGIIGSILGGGSSSAGASGDPNHSSPPQASASVDPGTSVGGGSPPATATNPAPGTSAANPPPAGTTAARPPPGTVVGGQTISADPSASGIVIGGTTIAPGAVTTISGTPISVGTSGIVIGTGAGATTVPVPGRPTQSQGSSGVTVVGGQTISADPSASGIVIGGTTLTPGAVTTISGTPISVGPSGIVIGGTTTISFSGSPTGATSSGITLDEAAFTAANKAWTVTATSGSSSGSFTGANSQPTTMTIGGTAITTASATVSMASAGLMVNGTLVPWTVVKNAVNPTATSTGSGSSASMGSPFSGRAAGRVTSPAEMVLGLAAAWIVDALRRV